jgi:cytochrome c oxidase subunit II
MVRASWLRRFGTVVVAAMLVPALAACSFDQPLSTLDPAGPFARSVARVWWVMFWGSLIITGGMIALGVFVTLRPSGRHRPGSARLFLVGGGLLFPGFVLVALMAYGFGPGFRLVPPGEPYRVDVIAHQWWWEIVYPDVDGGPLLDANEIHVPVGRPLLFTITAADVIHSFWVPKLGGKIDAIPGHRNRIVLQADATGVYRGQCSEFCGAQHARMGFHLEAHEEDALAERLRRLADRARPAADPLPGPGATAFVQHCAECHSIDPRTRRNIPAPNLAGVVDRHRIGAGWLLNDAGALRTWIAEHQDIKPGNRMLDFSHLDDRTIDDLVTFLEHRE